MKSNVIYESTTALAPRTFTLDQLLKIWIHEQANRTRSAETERAYDARLKEFRGVDLPDLGVEDLVALAGVIVQKTGIYTLRQKYRFSPLCCAKIHVSHSI